MGSLARRKWPALAWLAASVLCAQDEMTSLSGWRMMWGDDARWAAPDFDDSQWPLVRQVNTGPSAVLDRPGPQRAVWYRTAFAVPAWWSNRDLALGIWRLDDAYEVFANGVKIGEWGQLPPPRGGASDDGGVSAIGLRYRTHLIPASQTRGGEVRLAIRRWNLRGRIGWESHGFSPIPTWGEPVIGLATTVAQAGELLTYRNYFSGLPGLVSWMAILVCGLFCLRKWLREASAADLWLGLALIFSAAYWSLALPMHLTDWPKNSLSALVATAGTYAASNLFLGWFLAELVPAWRRPLQWASILIAAGVATTVVSSYYQVPDITIGVALRNLSHLAQFAISVAAAIALWRSGQSLPLPIVIGVALRAAVAIFTNTRNPVNYYFAGPFVFSLRRTSDLVVALALVWLLHSQARRERARREALARDLDAARRIQETLMGTGGGATPGFVVEAAYLPATEVGGDFYQVIPGGDGSLLVLVGDVSGKGLRAAMLAGSVVGSLRNELSRQPGQVLAHLNRSLVGRNDGGFVTACCVRIDADGVATVANAGHVAPYLNGREAEVEPGLPLGLAPGVEYGESRLELEDAALVLVSDGVVEAANATGELFGFHRTRELSTKSAHEIAEAAKAWGQNDDITVVTVARCS